MKQRMLKIRGMGVPRIFIWTLGVIHSHVLKTASVDNETGYICSSYVAGKCKLFNELSSKRVRQLENELKAVRAEAFDLMAEEVQIQKRLEEDVVNAAPSSVNEKRSAKRAAARRAEYLRKHETNIKRLGEIESKIRSCELNAKEELDAAASALQSCFTTYAHGMLFRPVQSSFIPPVEYTYCFELYQESHKEEDQQLRHILKEVFNYG